MSKKHFIALANVIRNYNEHAEALDRHPFDEIQLEFLADFCRQANPSFKHERWLAYIAGECGPNGGAIKKQAA